MNFGRHLPAISRQATVNLPNIGSAATDLKRIERDNDERLCRGQIERIGGQAIITVEKRNEAR